VEARGDGFVRKGTSESVTQIVTKMAKSLKNVVNPDDVIAEHGADTFRLYELFMGPLADSKPWNTRDIPGCRRFLERVWRLFVDEDGTSPVRPNLRADQQPQARVGDNLELEKHLNRAIARVDDSFKALNFNTGIAGLMSFVKETPQRQTAMDKGQAERFVLALAPFAPHMAEELWSRLGNEGGIARAPWPKVDARHLEDDEIELGVQVLGKLRGKARVAKGALESDVVAAARASVPQWLEGKTVVKTVVVPGKLVNFVVR
jgi:leucyl-tRNA synthetase